MGEKRRRKQQSRKRRRGVPMSAAMRRLREIERPKLIAWVCDDPTCLSTHGGGVKGGER